MFDGVCNFFLKIESEIWGSLPEKNLAAQKHKKRTSQFDRKYIQMGTTYRSSWRGPQMREGLSTTEIFGNFSRYFFVNFRDKASNII